MSGKIRPFLGQNLKEFGSGGPMVSRVLSLIPATSKLLFITTYHKEAPTRTLEAALESKSNILERRRQAENFISARDLNPLP